MRVVALSFVAMTLAICPAIVAAQPSSAPPVACACRADSGMVWADFPMTPANIVALRHALKVLDNAPEGKTLAIRNHCVDPTHCANRDWKAIPLPILRLEVLGHASSTGMFDDKRIRPESLAEGAMLVLSGRME